MKFVKEYTLTIGVVGNGYVIPNEGSNKYDENALVTLIVSDNFIKWKGPDAADVRKDNTILMDGNKSITAVFTTDIALYITDFIAYDSDETVLASIDELIVDDDTGAGIDYGKYNDHFEVINVMGPDGKNIDVLYVTTDFDNSVCTYPFGADYSNTDCGTVEFFMKVISNKSVSILSFLNYTEDYYFAWSECRVEPAFSYNRNINIL